MISYQVCGPMARGVAAIGSSYIAVGLHTGEVKYQLLSLSLSLFVFTLERWNISSSHSHFHFYCWSSHWRGEVFLSLSLLSEALKVFTLHGEVECQFLSLSISLSLEAFALDLHTKEVNTSNHQITLHFQVYFIKYLCLKKTFIQVLLLHVELEGNSYICKALGR